MPEKDHVFVNVRLLDSKQCSVCYNHITGDDYIPACSAVQNFLHRSLLL